MVSTILWKEGFDMDNMKIGRFIAQLRKENDLTQKNVADALNISNKTISKWECGLGLPDVSLWTDLSTIFGVDIAQMMAGEITPNKPDKGNMNNVRFYVCPSCHNVLSSTGSASIHCCGKKLEQLSPQENDQAPRITVETIDVDYFISIDHEMTRLFSNQRCSKRATLAYWLSKGVVNHKHSPIGYPKV